MKILNDLFDREILKYTFMPLGLSLLFWAVVFWLWGDDVINFVASLAQNLPYSDKIVSLIQSSSFLVLGGLYYLLSISTLGLFSSFFVDKIVLRINQKHYNCPVKEAGFKDTLRGVVVSLKALFLYFVIFIFTFWMLFIPVVNVVYQMFMWSILNKAPLEFDAGYLFDVEKKGIWWIVFLTSAVYFIPLLSYFGYSFQLIFVTHYILRSCK
ncbi:MAG: thiamine monophosphate kinase [Epsilonproteobacteria bacterium]|nr:thiamine monophosphate kinase [Campylobacterota bacterium]